MALEKNNFLKEKGTFVLDVKQHKIVENYERFIPDFSMTETWFAIFYITLGLVLILILDFYGRKKEV